MNRFTFDTQFVGLCDYFNKVQSETVINVYWEALKHLSDEQFSNAVSQVIINSTYFPRVPDLLKFAPPLPPLPQLENKGSLTWCANTQKLLNEYGVN